MPYVDPTAYVDESFQEHRTEGFYVLAATRTHANLSSMGLLAASVASPALDQLVSPVHAIEASAEPGGGTALCGVAVRHVFATIDFPIDVGRDVLCGPCMIQAHPQGADGLLMRELDMGNDRSGFMSFDEVPGFEPRWWNDYRYDLTQFRWYSIDSVCDEVARVELELDVQCGTHYGITPPPEGFVEISFIEVREQHRGKGFGRRTVEFLTSSLHPDRQFAAFSEEADPFWSALGWTGHFHPDDGARGPRHRTLFISPLRSPLPQSPESQ